MNTEHFQLPKPVTKKERRQWEADEAAHADRAMQRRPNVEPREDFDRCTQSKYQTHRMVRPTAGGELFCEFCHRAMKDCVKR